MNVLIYAGIKVIHVSKRAVKRDEFSLIMTAKQADPIWYQGIAISLLHIDEKTNRVILCKCWP